MDLILVTTTRTTSLGADHYTLNAKYWQDSRGQYISNGPQYRGQRSNGSRRIVQGLGGENQSLDKESCVQFRVFAQVLNPQLWTPNPKF